jgi:hypothetical protein
LTTRACSTPTALPLALQQLVPNWGDHEQPGGGCSGCTLSSSCRRSATRPYFVERDAAGAPRGARRDGDRQQA